MAAFSNVLHTFLDLNCPYRVLEKMFSEWKKPRKFDFFTFSLQWRPMHDGKREIQGDQVEIDLSYKWYEQFYKFPDFPCNYVDAYRIFEGKNDKNDGIFDGFCIIAGIAHPTTNSEGISELSEICPSILMLCSFMCMFLFMFMFMFILNFLCSCSCSCSVSVSYLNLDPWYVTTWFFEPLNFGQFVIIQLLYDLVPLGDCTFQRVIGFNRSRN